jgi:hypothetical protein
MTVIIWYLQRLPVQYRHTEFHLDMCPPYEALFNASWCESTRRECYNVQNTKSQSYQMHRDELGLGAGWTRALTSVLHERSGDVTLEGV